MLPANETTFPDFHNDTTGLIVFSRNRNQIPVGQILGHHLLAIRHVFERVEPIPKGRNVGAALLEMCPAGGIDLLVMGAYTHSRLRHLMFGGATSGILEHTEIPVLMHH